MEDTDPTAKTAIAPDPRTRRRKLPPPRSQPSQPDAALAAMLLAIPLALFAGHVFSVLWLWFVVPLGAPPLALAHASGLAMLISWATQQPTPGTEKATWAWLREVLEDALLRYLTVWGLGALLHAWM